MTNREYIIACLQGEIDDGGASEEACIAYNINCPYFEGDSRCLCAREGGDINRETCVECKSKWLESEVDE